MRTVRVPLAERSYNIFIGSQLLLQLGELLKSLRLGSRCLIVSDSNVAPLYADKVLATLRAADFLPQLAVVPAGEASKTIQYATQLFSACTTHQIDRQSFIIALGGGVVGDLAGFVAATYLRGIPLIQCPTTLLAQVDSSVGGKVGVNLPKGKNLVGAFWQPCAVFADLEAMRTLPPREFSSGMAEVIKSAAIKDAALFERLEEKLDACFNFELDTLGSIIARCCEIKAEVVSADERETKGLREILNFGHTIGHAVEAAGNYSTLLHGEAISIGMALAAKLSVQYASFNVNDAERLTQLLARCHLPTKIPPQISRDEILRRRKFDKKNRDGRLRFVLLKQLSEAVVSEAVTENDLSGLLS